MYKKITKGHPTVFKPRRMVIGGIVYNVSNEAELNKIKQEVALKKDEEAKKAEEIKNQKMLVKRTVTKGFTDVITKTVVDPNSLLTKRKNYPKNKRIVSMWKILRNHN